MAQNPQNDFDEDWEWPAEEGGKSSITSPIAGSQASVSWGVTNVRRLVPHNNQAQTPISRPSGVSRGRGLFRKTEATSQVFPIVDEQQRGDQSQQPFGRPIHGRSSDSSANTQNDRSTTFNFKKMATTLNTSLPAPTNIDDQKSPSSSGFSFRQSVPFAADNDNPKPSSSATGFSFRQAMTDAENSRTNTNHQRSTDSEFLQNDMNFDANTIDGQVSKLGEVLQNADKPLSLDHMHKLEVLRQDPNHPLYSVTTFESLDLKVELKSGLSADRKIKLSAIQEKTLPALISPPYRNCIAQSQNGTGKTVTFVVTMLSRVNFSKPCVQAICLLPTKELAQQVVETLNKLGRFFPDIQKLIFSAVRDSRPILNEDGKLKTPIVVGTAGTVNSLMRKTKQLVFDDVILFVVDEADKMLEQQSENFYTTIENIVQRLSPQAQRVFFSATFSDSVVELARKFMSKPLVIRLRDVELSLDNIRHFFLRVRNRDDKLQAMKLIYNALVVGQSIVFCATRAMSHWLCEQLRNQLDFKVAEIAGDMEPRDRDEQISRFRRSADRVLVSTNVCSRGLDISSVNLIINWDPPIIYDRKTADYDTYLHRVGRSGRFGADGIAVNMVEKDSHMQIYRDIERHFGIKVEELSCNRMSETLQNNDD